MAEHMQNKRKHGNIEHQDSEGVVAIENKG